MANKIAKGFIWSTEGTNIITVNGVEYTVTAGFGTDTITVASTAGISINDLVFQNVYFNDTLSGATIYDVCSIINNQVYYIDWNQRNVYISWNRNQIADLSTTIFNGVGLDDGIFSGTYTGTTQKTFKAIINSADPGEDIQEFIPGSAGSQNGATYDTSAYSGPAGTTNLYSVDVIADVTIGYSPTVAFVIGESIQGGTSQAEGIIVARQTVGLGELLGIKMLTTNGFIAGENITGLSSGLVVAITGSVTNRGWFQYSKNGVVVNTNTGFGSFPYNILFSSGAITLSDGLTFRFTSDTGQEVGDSYKLTIRAASIDTFQWTNGGALSAPIAITGGAQALSDGISITFSSTTGHTIGDAWTSIATQMMARGWSNFTYDNPNRLPGQGFTLLLDSNGWTMKPQERMMLINSQSGHFYDIEIKLSADLLGETVVVTRLKSEPQNKVLFPYLINYIKNQLATISNEKTFDVLGRQKFLELQQSKTISDAVRIDFATVDWEDADVLYFKRKIFFNIPRTTDSGSGGCIFVWDDYRKYWHSPQVFGKRISLLSVIDDKLIGHSYEQNESYELFVGENDLGLFPIATRMVFPYDSSGNRYTEKALSAIGFEGYMAGNPVIEYTINLGVGGCEGQKKGIISPLNTKAGICLPVDRASLGKSGLGFHGLGNDPVDVIPHFFYIKTFDNQAYYQRNIEISCDSLDQRWSLISLGTDLNASGINNVTITDLD